LKRSPLTKRTGAAAGIAGAVALAFMAPSTAFANPAEEPDPNPSVLTASQLLTVPDGVCAVNVIVAGAPGGLAISTGDVEPDPDNPGEMRGANGAGGLVGAGLNVKAGDQLEVVVGAAGGNGGGAGAPGGGAGGTGGHRGGGGGGYSSISVDGDLLLLAGGGGTGGGHSEDHGFGGDAGWSIDEAIFLPEGLVFPGGDGTAGQDSGWNQDPATAPLPGEGGGTSGGAGGTNPQSGGSHSFDGFDGGLLQGGNGGPDNGYDSGGAGGGGYFGGGGGAATDGDVGSNPNWFGGAGGGGGSSFAADSGLITADSLWLGKNRIPQGEENEGVTKPAYVSFEYIMCDYQLNVVKSVVGVVDEAGTDGTLIRTSPVFEAGDIVRYAVTVTNTAGDDMGVGNTVTLIDDLAAGGTVVSVTGLNTVDPTIDGTIPNVAGDGVVEVYDEVDLNGDPDNPRLAKRGLDLGQSVTIVYDVEVDGDGPVVNTVSVADPKGVAIADAVVDPADPELALVKSTDAQKATTVGQKITYSFLVTNTGNIELSNIAIDEGSFSGKGELPDPTCPTTELEPGEPTTCTSVYTVVAGDLTGADLTNTATAVGQTPGGTEVVSAVAEAKIPSEKPAPVLPLVTTGGDSLLGYAGIAAFLLVLGGAALAVTSVRRRGMQS